MLNVVAFDVGSSCIRCAIARVSPETRKWRILGFSTITSRGVQQGVIVDVLLAKEAMEQALSVAERDLDSISIHKVYVNVGPELAVHDVDTDIDIAGGVVSYSDVESLHSKEAASVEQDPNYESRRLVSLHPQFYLIDGGQTPVSTLPVELAANKLSSRVKALTIGISHYRNMEMCLLRNVKMQMVASSYASMSSCLSADVMRHGCVVVDIGYGYTSYGVIGGDCLLTVGSFPLGGSDITAAIAHIFMLSLEEAEALKLKYGFATSTAKYDANSIPTRTILGESREISQGDLIDVIGAKFDDIMQRLFEELEGKNLLSARNYFVLTGKMFATPGLGFEQRAQNYLNQLKEEYETAQIYGVGYESLAQKNVRKHTLRVDIGHAMNLRATCENWQKYQYLESSEYSVLVGLLILASKSNPGVLEDNTTVRFARGFIKKFFSR